MRAASATGAPLKFAGFAAQETSSGCLVRAQAFAWSSDQYGAENSSFTRAPRAAPWRSRRRRVVSSRVSAGGLALAIRTVALGGPKADQADPALHHLRKQNNLHFELRSAPIS